MTIVLVMIAFFTNGGAHVEVLPLPDGTTLAECEQASVSAEKMVDPTGQIIKFGFKCVAVPVIPTSEP